MRRRDNEGKAVQSGAAQFSLNIGAKLAAFRYAEEQIVEQEFDLDGLRKIDQIRRPAANFKSGHVVDCADDLSIQIKELGSGELLAKLPVDLVVGKIPDLFKKIGIEQHVHQNAAPRLRLQHLGPRRIGNGKRRGRPLLHVVGGGRRNIYVRERSAVEERTQDVVGELAGGDETGERVAQRDRASLFGYLFGLGVAAQKQPITIDRVSQSHIVNKTSTRVEADCGRVFKPKPLVTLKFSCRQPA